MLEPNLLINMDIAGMGAEGWVGSRTGSYHQQRLFLHTCIITHPTKGVRIRIKVHRNIRHKERICIATVTQELVILICSFTGKFAEIKR